MNKQKLLCIALAVGLILSTVSCAYLYNVARAIKKDDLTIDPNFSINLAKPQKNWPKKKKMTKTEKEVFEKYGKPDLVRIWWNKKGNLVSQAEVREMFKNTQKNYTNLKKSWLYEEEEKEIIFQKDGTYKEEKFTDRLRTMVENGDPEEIKIGVKVYNEVSTDRWTYWSKGKHFDFVEDKLVKTDTFTPMGGTFSRN